MVSSCILLAGGGASRIHDHSAIILNGFCIVAVGPFVVSLSLSSLELDWVTQSDDATCFGVYHCPDHRCLISHGELEISRLSYAGSVEWHSGGADIFSGGFCLDGDVIRVVDFCDREYAFDIATGQEMVA